MLAMRRRISDFFQHEVEQLISNGADVNKDRDSRCASQGGVASLFRGESCR